MTTDMKTIQETRELQAEDAETLKRVQLSALADGQLRGAAFADALALFGHDSFDGGQARATWHTLHVVGDVLRAAELAACRKDAAFLARLTTALQQEPSLKPNLLEPRNATVFKDSANEPTFRWQWVAGLSSVAAALAIGWNLVGGTAATSGAQLAQIATPLSAPLQAVELPNDAAGAVMLRSSQLDAMIAAHSQLGGSSALQMPSGFLRSATFNGADR